MAWYTICKEIRKNERKSFHMREESSDRRSQCQHCSLHLRPIMRGKAGCPAEFVVKVVVDLWVVTLF